MASSKPHLRAMSPISSSGIEVNERIACARAESVKSILMKKYRIAASRITAEGQGIGDMFSEPDWNRVSICTLQENK